MFLVEAYTRFPDPLRCGVYETLVEAIDSIETPVSGYTAILLSNSPHGYWVTLDNSDPTTHFPSRMAWFLREVPF